MGAANGSTFDLTPARRPSLDDCGGTGLLDDVAAPPDPETMPNAAMLNAGNAHSAAYGAVVPHTVISVHIAAGVPGIALVASARTGVTAGTFTIADNGAGDTSITWAAGTFPPAVAYPTGSMNSDGNWLAPVFIPIANGVRVKTRSNAPALADGDFTVEIR